MRHVEALDGLRAVAVLIVILSHAGLGHIVPGGFGVTIFFFLSGYLITTLIRLEIAKAGKLDFFGFYLRRTVRIIPPMMICIVATVALIAAGGIERQLDHRWLWTDFLFLTNYAAPLGTSSNIPIPLWSLDVEEHFYLIFPLLYVLARKRSVGAAFWMIAVGILLALLLRIMQFSTMQDPSLLFYWTHARIDSILFGCVLAVWNNPVANDRALIGAGLPWFVGGLALIAGTLLVRDPLFREVWRYSFQGIGLFLIFNYVLRTYGLVNQLLSHRALKWVGDRSYVLYLIHLPMFLAAEKFAGAGPVSYALGFVLAAAFAAAMYRFVEQPLLRWRKNVQSRGRRVVSEGVV